MSAPKIFTSEYYAHMRALEADSWWNAAMRDIAAELLDWAGLPPRGTLLDVGAGSGQSIAWFLQAHPGWRAVGLDVAPQGLLAARAAGVGCMSRASALSLPHAARTIDLVLTLDVLQHLPLDGGDVAALREMHRVLKPAGLLLLRTNAQALPRTTDDRGHNFHKYQPLELEAKLRMAGFTVRRLSRLNALLGLAEIPREWRARHASGDRYHGILGNAAPGYWWPAALKRAWLRLEGRAVQAGWRLPFGRTIVALCQA